MSTLHILSIGGEGDQVIATDVKKYALTPDGGKIVICEGGTYTGHPGIFVVDKNGSNKRRIADVDSRFPSPIYCESLLVSPTGESVAFVSNDGVFTLKLDGTDLHQIVAPPDAPPNHRVEWTLLDWR